MLPFTTRNIIKDWFRTYWYGIIPVLVFSLTTTLGVGESSELNDHNITPPDLRHIIGSSAREGSAHFHFITSLLAFITACLIGVCGTISLGLRRYSFLTKTKKPYKSHADYILATLVIFVPTTCLIGMSSLGWFNAPIVNPMFYEVLGTRVWEDTIGTIHKSPFLNEIDHILFFSNVIVAFSAILITVSLCKLSSMALESAKNFNRANKEKKISASQIENIKIETLCSLEEKSRILKYLLFFTSIILIAGTNLTKTWAEWPLVFWNSTSNDYKDFVDAWVGHHAFAYTLLLVAVFLPSAFRLRRAINLVKEITRPPSFSPQRDISTLESNFVSGALDTVQKFTAIIAPILTPALGESLSQLAGKFSIL